MSICIYCHGEGKSHRAIYDDTVRFSTEDPCKDTDETESLMTRKVFCIPCEGTGKLKERGE